MLISEPAPGETSYRVEISGWDEDESFFVEKSSLAGDELMGKHVALEHRITDGAIVFVRVLLPNSYHRSCPVAYQAEFQGFDPDGLHVFRLSPAQPRYGSPEYAVN